MQHIRFNNRTNQRLIIGYLTESMFYQIMIRRIYRICVVGLILVGIGCEGGGQEDTASGDSKETLEDLLGPAFSPDYDATADLNAEQDRRIASCMTEKGFEWEPTPLTPALEPEVDLDLEYGTYEWVQRYGFGITTLWFPQSAVGPELVGYEDEPDLARMPEDPNTDYLRSLSATEKAAWDIALSGDPNSGAVGCQDSSVQEVIDSMPYAAFVVQFGDDYANVMSRIDADQRVIEFDDKMSKCVAESGKVYTSDDQIREDFQRRLDSIDQIEIDSLEESVDSEDVSAPVGIPPDPEMTAIGSSLSQKSKERLKSLQEEEVQLALAVWNCGGSERDLFLSDILDEYEAEFIEANRAKISEFAERWD